MGMVKRRLADALAENLTPVRQRGFLAPALAWLIGCWLAISMWMAVTGGPRPGLAEQILVPRFATEILLGITAATAALVVGLLLSVPGRVGIGRAWSVALVPLALWVALLSLGLWSPALEPSMAGKRHHCDIETLILAVLPLGVGLVLAARLAPLSRVTIGALLGLAAAGVPALLMQLFCMYEPWHALTRHLLPIGLVGVLGAIAGRVFLPRY